MYIYAYIYISADIIFVSMIQKIETERKERDIGEKQMTGMADTKRLLTYFAFVLRH
jgi:hypothetical protein